MPDEYVYYHTNCGIELTYIPQYSSWYCHLCQTYATKETSSRGSTEINYHTQCGGRLTWIPQYSRWYCYKCQTYAPKKPSSPESDSTTECHNCKTTFEGKFCPSCGTRWTPHWLEGLFMLPFFGLVIFIILIFVLAIGFFPAAIVLLILLLLWFYFRGR